MSKWITSALLVLAAILVASQANAQKAACTTDAQCDDRRFCNGVEICHRLGGRQGVCGIGVPPSCSAGCTETPQGAQCVICTRDADCADETFCNGAERCTPGAAGADGSGCAPSLTFSPCVAGQTCDEQSRSCLTECSNVEVRDGDEDGADSIDCGGNDCDDSNPERFPGNDEICDANHVDEDCDPATFGFRDADEDHFIDASCCNSGPGLPTHCGDDCDDQNPAIHPGAMSCGSSPNEIRICKNREFGGDYRSERCFDDRTCLALENGTGICLTPAPPNPCPPNCFPNDLGGCSCTDPF